MYDKMMISVKDNGKGIPQKIVDKICLDYDIIKAHGGDITVETVEGEGSGFNIVLPIA